MFAHFTHTSLVYIQEITTTAHDKAGRVIGAKVSVYDVKIEANPGVPFGLPLEHVGANFRCIPLGTRDGEVFGPSRRAHFFKTEKQVEAYIAKVFRATLKRTAAGV